MAVLTFDLHTHLLEKGIHPDVYWRAVAEKKLDAVAITEHIEEKPKLAYELLLEKKPKGIALLPGMELNTNIGHVVAISDSPGIYGIGEFLQKGLDIKKAIELAEKNSALLSIAHPWGFKYDSASAIIGEKRLETLVEENYLGVEAFNGMMGNVGNFVYGTNWIKKPLNFFDFLEKNRVARKTRIDRIGKRIRKKLDQKSKEVIERCTKPIELGAKASFITAGSDAHSASRIGSGIMKVKAESGKLDNESIINAIRQKRNVVWVGPFVEESDEGGYKVSRVSLHKSEIIAGLRYATISTGRKRLGKIGSSIKKKIGRKGKK